MNNVFNRISPVAFSPLNNVSNITYCPAKFSLSQCQLIAFVYDLLYVCMSLALLPQILHLYKYRTRYIAGISYISIIIRILACTSLLIARVLKWRLDFDLITIILSTIVFVQIIDFSNNYFQNKLILIVISLFIWIIGGSIMLLFAKHENLLINIGYGLLAIQMLPQILLNSCLRTTAALSLFSIYLLFINDMLLFNTIIFSQGSFITLIPIYYSCSFYVFIFLQFMIYEHTNIYVISRSGHTLLTPGFDTFTGLDPHGIRSGENDPQMFSVGDVESTDGSDVIYQPVTTTKSPMETASEKLTKKCQCYVIILWTCFEMILTVLLVNYVRSIWIIFVPIFLPILLGTFFLLRTKLSSSQIEHLKKFL